MAALRATQLTVEMLYLPNPPALRSTQQTVEMVYLPPPVSLRSTQQTLECLYLPPVQAQTERQMPRGENRGAWRQ